MVRFLISCAVLPMVGQVGFGGAFAPVLNVQPFLVFGADYNDDPGVSPTPRLDLAKLHGVTVTSSDGTIPWRETIPGTNGRDLVIEATIRLSGRIEPGHKIDLYNRVYAFINYESTYHTYWTSAPVDDQYGRLSSWRCLPAENRCEPTGETKLGESPGPLTPYYLTNASPTDSKGRRLGAYIEFAFDPIGDGRYTRVSAANLNNNGTAPIVPTPSEIRIRPHPDGVQTWLELNVGAERHAITLRTARPLSTWAEVDDWAMRIRERTREAASTEHWLNGVKYHITRYVTLPEPTSGAMSLLALMVAQGGRRRRFDF